MKNLIRIILCVLAITLLSNACSSVNNTPTATGVDLKRYMGKWYEIARFETSFQQGIFDSFAEYKLLDNGIVLIENSGTDQYGNRTSAKARGYAPDPKNPSKLRISFFRPFYSDYFILALDKNYQWALVGSSSKDYLWILSRTPTLPTETTTHVVNIAKNLGYDTSKFIYNTDLAKVMRRL